ncbi:IS6 family transposase, partial [Candidatus Erwinia dacicola]|nr:IS6 family transposase [Candidatus Erwinia dacicola]
YQPSGFGSWHLDETYVEVNGRWAYLYRAVDSRGCTIDFYLSSRRHTKAAYRFMGKLLNNTKRLQIPRLINTDKAPTYGRALALLKRGGKCPQHVHHRQIKYRNNIIECDHANETDNQRHAGLQINEDGLRTIKGIEVMRRLQKGQAESFYLGHPLGDASGEQSL